jgi:Holliday junction DNA helicase RuvA
MIEHLAGRLLVKSPTRAVISCGGVGYALLITLAAYEQLPDVGQEVAIDTWLSVKEDALTLFGFRDAQERELFQLLNSVSGVGPKTAIGMLSGMGTKDIRRHIAESNTSALTALPGIGKKSAERIVVELREKVRSLGEARAGGDLATEGGTSTWSDAVAALVELGFSQKHAEQSVGRVHRDAEDQELSVEELIKRSLRLLQR